MGSIVAQWLALLPYSTGALGLNPNPDIIYVEFVFFLLCLHGLPPTPRKHMLVGLVDSV